MRMMSFGVALVGWRESTQLDVTNRCHTARVKESYLVLLLVGHESSSTSAQEARYTRGRGAGLGLGYDARALENPWRQKLACCVGAKVTLKRLAARGGMLFNHDSNNINQRNWERTLVSNEYV